MYPINQRDIPRIEEFLIFSLSFCWQRFEINDGISTTRQVHRTHAKTRRQEQKKEPWTDLSPNSGPAFQVIDAASLAFECSIEDTIVLELSRHHQWNYLRRRYAFRIFLAFLQRFDRRVKGV